MHCVVTAGPTYESLDGVRRLTNQSTGRLGCELATHLFALGHDVTLLLGEQATHPGERRATRTIRFTSTNDLADRLAQTAGPNVDAVFHAAAVSDFQFGKVYSRDEHGVLHEIRSGKFETRSGTLLAELTPTPKLISRLRTWFPDALLVGWKYEVDGDRGSVLTKAREQIEVNATDGCVVNGPAWGEGFGIVDTRAEVIEIADRTELYDRLARLARA